MQNTWWKTFPKIILSKAHKTVSCFALLFLSRKCLFWMDAHQIKKAISLAWRMNDIINEIMKMRFFLTFLSMKEDLLKLVYIQTSNDWSSKCFCFSGLHLGYCVFWDDGLLSTGCWDEENQQCDTKNEITDGTSVKARSYHVDFSLKEELRAWESILRRICFSPSLVVSLFYE